MQVDVPLDDRSSDGCSHGSFILAGDNPARPGGNFELALEGYFCLQFNSNQARKQERKKRGAMLTRHNLLPLFGIPNFKFIAPELDSFREKVSRTKNNTRRQSVCEELPCTLLVWSALTPSTLFVVARFFCICAGFEPTTLTRRTSFASERV